MYKYEIISAINRKERVKMFLPDQAYATRLDAVGAAEKKLTEIIDVLKTFDDWKPEYHNEFEIRVMEV